LEKLLGVFGDDFSMASCNFVGQATIFISDVVSGKAGGYALPVGGIVGGSAFAVGNIVGGSAGGYAFAVGNIVGGYAGGYALPVGGIVSGSAGGNATLALFSTFSKLRHHLQLVTL